MLSFQGGLALRSLLLRLRLDGGRLPPDDFAEVRRGLMTKGVIRTNLEPGPAWPRIANAASLGLQLGPYGPAHLSSLTFRLENLHPTRKALTFQLPRGAPEMWVDGRKGDGKLVQAPPVLHQVVIEPDDDRVSVVWRGSVPTLRRYTIEELVRMPLLMNWPEEEGCGSILCPTEIDRGTKTAECPRFCAERTWALA